MHIMNPARLLWVGLVAGLLFTGCAVAPVAAKPKPQTGPQLKSSAGHFSGIGLELTSRSGPITVVSILTGSPASQSGLQPGDLIVEINGEATEGMTLPEAVSRIRGEVNTAVKLKARRPSTQETKEYTITRIDIAYRLGTPARQGSSSAPATLAPPANSATPF